MPAPLGLLLADHMAHKHYISLLPAAWWSTGAGLDQQLESGKPLKLVRRRVQCNHEPVATTRAPEASVHTTMVLLEIGMAWERIEAPKAKAAIARHPHPADCRQQLLACRSPCGQSVSGEILPCRAINRAAGLHEQRFGDTAGQ